MDAERLHTQRVHKVIIDCEAGDDEDCQERIRVETLEDGTHTVHVDDHEMTWIEAGHGGAGKSAESAPTSSSCSQLR